MNKKQTFTRSKWEYALMLPFVVAFLLFNSTSCTMATKEKSPAMQNTVDNSIKDSVQIDTMTHIVPFIDGIDPLPQFPGGSKALMQFLLDNLKYPAAENSCIQGRVVLRFVVTTDGSIENVEVMKSLDPSCDAEAIRVVKAMPKWIPGKQNGKPVSTYYSLPVKFSL